ncbi:copper amine oxidase N-terminal domain-containing protein [Paenibacillus sp. EKM202P]|uniref:copper amine oxidase N-terminal domain-containing protein n=1 Tax=unclassified Paenibacillus TaxID=185978 RepID=UPI0013EBB9E0|nr:MULTISPECIES: copper amine oxidase N-terminal domain-containing protein [unclassified Paenibacillus]KAF6566966.1 copper amine oxidase N-terminal domain-containing protein [Paenibacillus sp. EKM202P]KAF6572208.1 copper amine oxidase N-terminal domain-containing protein [Paenibacillus sp. EKM207P]MCV9950665.1 copper amine oxidase N-terminal domain-containing protein [Paenibacillus sp. BT-177]
MNKAFFGAFLAIFLCISSSTAYAAQNQIKIDGVAIATDAKPQMKNKRTMVPLRVISESLGASVEWSDSEVILAKSDMKVKLAVNRSTAEKNGQKIPLDVKPYLKNNNIYVPLRFIAETFGCNVNYSNFAVTINTEPLLIDGVQVKALQQEYHMIMGGVVQQIHGNAYNETIYNIFAKNKGQKVEAPENYSWSFTIDTPGSYYKNAQYDFLDQKGKSLARFDVYSLIQSFPSEVLIGYPKFLIHDVSKDEWYLFSDSAAKSINQLINNATNNGFLKVISNTVA